jgi:hypothetical protein
MKVLIDTNVAITNPLYTLTFTVITTDSSDPASVSAHWIGTALWAARSASL